MALQLICAVLQSPLLRVFCMQTMGWVYPVAVDKVMDFTLMPGALIGLHGPDRVLTCFRGIGELGHACKVLSMRSLALRHSPDAGCHPPAAAQACRIAPMRKVAVWVVDGAPKRAAIVAKHRHDACIEKPLPSKGRKIGQVFAWPVGLKQRCGLRGVGAGLDESLSHLLPNFKGTGSDGGAEPDKNLIGYIFNSYIAITGMSKLAYLMKNSL